jgi:hypothetical protein
MLVEREPSRAAASSAYQLDAVVPLSGKSAGITSSLESCLHNGFKSFACCMNFNSVWDSCARRERLSKRCASVLGERVQGCTRLLFPRRRRKGHAERNEIQRNNACVFSIAYTVSRYETFRCSELKMSIDFWDSAKCSE